jgi:hypothetical protein
LIEKCHALNSKKPAFKWVGLHGVITQVNELKELNLQYIKLKKQQSCNTMVDHGKKFQFDRNDSVTSENEN